MRRLRSSASRLTGQRYGIGRGCAFARPPELLTGASLPSRGQLAAIGLLELRDVEPGLLEHRLHRPLRAFGIRSADQLVELARHDLPRDAEPVLQPAAH